MTLILLALHLLGSPSHSQRHGASSCDMVIISNCDDAQNSQTIIFSACTGPLSAAEKDLLDAISSDSDKKQRNGRLQKHMGEPSCSAQ